MANEIKAKFGTVEALTITLADVANGAGRTGLKVDNSSDLFQRIVGYVKLFKAAAAGTGTFKVYLLREDNHATEYTTDGITLADAALATEPPNAELVGLIKTDATAGAFYADFVIEDPGHTWTIVIWNASGAALHATEANSYVHYQGVNPEVQ